MTVELVADSLSKEYAGADGPLGVLREVSLRLVQGESASVTGPSGSGKSTLLNILGALEPPTAGRVRLGERDPFALGESELASFRNRAVGFVFQDHLLLPQCSVLENVLVPTLVAPPERAALERARELLGRVGLAARLEHRPAELSGGERQRVAIARALINRPLLLLADEPTGNLDAATAGKVADLILELHRQENTILIIVTHNPALAARCARRFELAEGRLRET